MQQRKVRVSVVDELRIVSDCRSRVANSPRQHSENPAFRLEARMKRTDNLRIQYILTGTPALHNNHITSPPRGSGLGLLIAAPAGRALATCPAFLGRAQEAGRCTLPMKRGKSERVSNTQDRFSALFEHLFFLLGVSCVSPCPFALFFSFRLLAYQFCDLVFFSDLSACLSNTLFFFFH